MILARGDLAQQTMDTIRKISGSLRVAHHGRTGELVVAVMLLVSTAAGAESLFHSAPKPLSKDAKTQDWPRFLGPYHNAISGETKLLHLSLIHISEPTRL